LCDKRGLNYDEYLNAGSTTELYHFIGKDISYFHNLFWPAVLHGAGCRKPTAVFVHGFLTINGAKMSKSRGTFITAAKYLSLLPPEPLRFYFATKLNSAVEDIDLSLEDFTARVNSDIVGKLVNIASRCAGFVQRGGGRLAAQLPDPQLYAEFAALRSTIGDLYDARDYSAALRGIMGLADRANQYVDSHKPWALAKDPAKAAEVLAVCTQGVNLFRVLMSYLAPVLPQMAGKAGKFLNISFAEWNFVDTPLLDHPINVYEPLATRLDPQVVAKLVETDAGAAPVPAVKPEKKARTVTEKPAAVAAAPGFININDFAKLDLRVATVLEAKLVEGSDKLLQLTLDLGTEKRNVFSGFRSAYGDPSQLVGRQVVMIANLEPRKMRFGVSEGMVLCASKGDAPEVFLLSADAGAQAGMKVT
jgi:methionyl-tRNA synthetase